jgi:protein TonB
MTGNRRLLILLAISASLHALVLALSSEASRMPAAATAANEPLRMTLLAPVRVPPAARSDARPAASTHEPSAPSPSPVTSVTEQESGHEQTGTDIRGRQIEVALTSALRPHFYYPPLARQHGWQGEVRLALRVEADGLLTQVRVVRTSGYGILDRAALHSLGRIQRLPEAVAVLNGRSHDVILPVQYRLTGIF